ncbi:MAG: helix-turn-helix domain-containing protein [Lachnospiraceae bacterium]|nr:helix-turn-helix domain-containing protein [Lachnospiraceae bacterium]
MRLSENIRSLRKEHSLTQEQLAEALGLTASAVYKWEAGLSTPDISMLIELADRFDTSVDALLGYEVRNNKRDTAVAKLKDFLYHKDVLGLAEADKLLGRYPNCFEIVYQSAVLYRMFGFMHRNNEWLQRSIELLERTRLLLGQNTDAEISELTINMNIADAYFEMGESEKALELFMRTNPNGINNNFIGFILGSACNRLDEALPYLSMALLNCIESMTRTVIGYFHVYFKQRNFSAADNILRLTLQFFSGLKASDRTSSLDKTSTELCIYLAVTQIELGDTGRARDSLCMAKTLADRFDKNPDYNMDSIRFVEARRPTIAFDNMGTTAMDCILRLLETYKSETLMTLWNEIAMEEQCRHKVI